MACNGGTDGDGGCELNGLHTYCVSSVPPTKLQKFETNEVLRSKCIKAEHTTKNFDQPREVGTITKNAQGVVACSSGGEPGEPYCSW